MTDELAATLAEIAGREGRFGHREHIQLAFIAGRRHGPTAIAELMREWIKEIAAAHGAADKYHETMTIAWAMLVAHHVAADLRSPTSVSSSTAIRLCLTRRCLPGITRRAPSARRRRGQRGSHLTWSRSPPRADPAHGVRPREPNEHCGRSGPRWIATSIAPAEFTRAMDPGIQQGNRV